MSLVMEYVAVVIYTIVGATTPLQNDFYPGATVDPSGEYPMKHEQAYVAPQTYVGGYAPPTHTGYAPQSYVA